MTNYEIIFTQEQIESTDNPTFQIMGNSGCSVKIENESPYVVKVYSDSVLKDVLQPYAYVILPNTTPYELKVDKSMKTTSQQDYQYIGYKMLEGTTKYENSSTNFNGAQRVNITNSEITANISNSELAVTVANSNINVSIDNVPTVQLSGDTVVNARIDNANINSEIVNTTIAVQNNVLFVEGTVTITNHSSNIIVSQMVSNPEMTATYDGIAIAWKSKNNYPYYLSLLDGKIRYGTTDLAVCYIEQFDATEKGTVYGSFDKPSLCNYVTLEFFQQAGDERLEDEVTYEVFLMRDGTGTETAPNYTKIMSNEQAVGNTNPLPVKLIGGTAEMWSIQYTPKTFTLTVGSYVPVEFEVEQKKNMDFTFNSFIAPVTGKYKVETTALFVGLGTSLKNIFSRLLVGTNVVVFGATKTTSSNIDILTFSKEIDLVQGQRLQWTIQAGTGSPTGVVLNGVWSNFIITKLPDVEIPGDYFMSVG